MIVSADCVQLYTYTVVSWDRLDTNMNIDLSSPEKAVWNTWTLVVLQYYILCDFIRSPPPGIGPLESEGPPEIWRCHWRITIDAWWRRVDLRFHGIGRRIWE